MQFSPATLAFLYAYQVHAVFLGAFFLGETVLIPAAFLAGEGIFSLGVVFGVAFAGTILSDIAWFVAGPALFRFAHQFEKIAKRSEDVLARIQAIYADKPFRALLVSKFVYGTRILTIIYLSSRKLSPVRFLLANLWSTFVWLVAVVAVGFLAGKSIINLLPVVSDIKYILFFLVILIVGFQFAPKWLTKRLPWGKGEENIVQDPLSHQSGQGLDTNKKV